MRPVLLPCARLAKSHFAPWRQSILADIPFLKLPPIEDGFRRIARGNRNIRWAFTLDDSQHKVSSCLTNLVGTCKETASSAASKVGFRVDDDGPVSRFSNQWKNISRHIRSL